MAYTAPLAVTTGSLATASQYNTYTKDNIIAIYAGAMAVASQATGDLMYASSASQLGRIAAVAVGQVLKSAGTGTVPAWTAVPLVDGVAFPATQVSSADANTFDDYEEGTWTPVLGGSGGTSGQTYGVQTGSYIKIGRTVHAWCYIELTAKGTITTSVQMQGLPFATANVANTFSPALMPYFNTLATNWAALGGYASPNTSAVFVQGVSAPGTTTVSLTTTDIADTTALMFAIDYRAAA